MLKVVIFDFDGTLADTGHILYKAYGRLIKKHKLKTIPPEQLEAMRSLPIRERFRKAGVPLLKLPRLAADVIPIFSEFIGSAVPFPGIVELVRSLKEEDFILMIVSSNSARNIDSFLKANDLDLFDHVYCTSSLFGKHRIIKRVLKEIGVSSADAIYVGDELRDINSCKKVPIKIIAVSWGYDHVSLLKKGSPDYLVHSPEEIGSLLKGL